MYYTRLNITNETVKSEMSTIATALKSRISKSTIVGNGLKTHDMKPKELVA